MSRSYKKNPGYCDRNPWMKRYANRRVRRKSVDFEIADGRAYKKLVCSYDICDWKFLDHMTDEQLKRHIRDVTWYSWRTGKNEPLYEPDDVMREFYRRKGK